jgi:S-adenosylmethionine hydrolase
MIVLFTDYGTADPYVGQLHGVLAREAPGVPVVDLMHTVPNFDIRAGAYLLAALAPEFPLASVFVCVVDPGVGGTRAPVMVNADGRWYVGPDNGLLGVLAQRALRIESYAIDWRPARLTPSFHGRDLFAPVAARLARGERPDASPVNLTRPDWPQDLAQVLYIDHYGNAITGLRAQTLTSQRRLRVGRAVLGHARVFDDAPRGRPFWYANSNGLVELAMRQDSAARRMRLRVGTPVRVLEPDKSRIRGSAARRT